MPDDTYVHRINDMENDAAFPFDDIILSGNVIPASTLQNLMRVEQYFLWQWEIPYHSVMVKV